jgi:hypothetical protein
MDGARLNLALVVERNRISSSTGLSSHALAYSNAIVSI